MYPSTGGSVSDYNPLKVRDKNRRRCHKCLVNALKNVDYLENKQFV